MSIIVPDVRTEDEKAQDERSDCQNGHARCSHGICAACSAIGCDQCGHGRPFKINPTDKLVELAKIVENDRWWQAFCGPMTLTLEGDLENDLPKLVELRAKWADLVIAKAKKRGRL